MRDSDGIFFNTHVLSSMSNLNCSFVLGLWHPVFFFFLVSMAGIHCPFLLPIYNALGSGLGCTGSSPFLVSA